MKFLSKRPDLICWNSIPVLVTLGILFKDHTLDIQLYDTYYLIAYSLLAIVFCFLMVLYAAIYSFSRYAGLQPRSAFVAWQMLLTFGGFLALTLVVLWTGWRLSNAPGGMDGYWSIGYDFIVLILVTIIAIVVGFFLMIFNLVEGITRRSRVT